jgi:hypothetical protein
MLSFGAVTSRKTTTVHQTLSTIFPALLIVGWAKRSKLLNNIYGHLEVHCAGNADSPCDFVDSFNGKDCAHNSGLTCTNDNVIQYLIAQQSTKVAEKTIDNTESDSISAKYNELLMAVSNKYKGETRHETALKAIKFSETIRMAGKSETEHIS